MAALALSAKKNTHGYYWSSDPDNIMSFTGYKGIGYASLIRPTANSGYYLRCVSATSVAPEPEAPEPEVPKPEVPIIDPSTPGYYKEDTYVGVGVKIYGLWWAPVNAGYTDDPYGLLFNWGKNVGFKYATTGESIDDGHWKHRGQGPCPNGWRVPTPGEFAILLEKSPFGTDGRPGQRREASADTPNGHAGRWYGPDSETATSTAPGNSVFFPASGVWGGSGDEWSNLQGLFSGRSLFACYWSSVSGTCMHTSSGIYWGLTPDNGFPVRCVRNE